MGSIGFSELLLIFFVVLLLFGGKKLPELARSMGAALREFRRAANEIEEPIKDTKEEVEKEIKGAE
ncbi:sec-independent protein translocase protein TatA [Thermosulfidibacter takaii ABI70S6]|uniref:Sec-independent protein translocase protein TatA n=1 Tax=Thermosulfidibacter takaii (strain DSM 17441 / JCM 13301 / NBRC 103674 / ABI70S6) TaxID=1298851 RepID=A0A0S3QUE1_THET7|nr:twin-arginine translocase TatA/TatE family subunit [Thermosulfidibacter takaii]BAT71942.1 sec-independent protein translocase protein TatA [Thermosulfidibacter takaii ABI70S6]